VFKIDKYCIVLALFAFFMPLSRVLNVNSILIVLLFFFFIYDVCVIRKRISINHLTISLILFSLINLVSLIYSQDINKALKEAIKISPLILIPISLIGKEGISKKELNVILKSFFLGNLTALMYCFALAIYNFKTDPIPLKEGFSYFTKPIDIHPSYFSIYLLISFYAILKMQTNKKVLTQVTLWGFLLLLTIFLRSKVALLLYVIIVLIELFKLKKVFLISSLVIFVLMFFIFRDNFLLVKTLSGRDWTISLVERFEIWNSAFKVISNNIIFGVGIGDVQIALDKSYYLNGFYNGIDRKLNAHNQFIQSFLGIGLLGLLSLLCVFYFLILKALKTHNMPIFYFTLCSFLLMFVESQLILQHGIYFFALFTTVFFKLKKEEQDRDGNNFLKQG